MKSRVGNALTPQRNSYVIGALGKLKVGNALISQITLAGNTSLDGRHWEATHTKQSASSEVPIGCNLGRTRQQDSLRHPAAAQTRRQAIVKPTDRPHTNVLVRNRKTGSASKQSPYKPRKHLVGTCDPANQTPSHGIT